MGSSLEETVSKEEQRLLALLKKSKVSEAELKTILRGADMPKVTKKKVTVPKTRVTFGLISDSHIGSVFYNESAMDQAAETFNKRKVDFVLHGGDVVEGHYENRRQGSVFELSEIGGDAQVKRAVDELSKISKKIPIYFITGNHESVVKQTEILTENGWKNVQEVVEDDKVGQFDINTKEITFSKPLELISHKAEKVINIESNNHKQKVTFNHDVVIDGTKIKARELIGKTLFQNQLIHSGFVDQKGVDLSDDWIRLLTWVITDGCLVDQSKYEPNSIKKRIQFKLSKDRKIKSLTDLLNRMGFKYTFKECKKSGINILQPYYIRIYGEYAREVFNKLGGQKEYPSDWINLDRNQLDVLLDTLQETDGTLVGNVIHFTCKEKKSIDFVQRVCMFNGINSRVETFLSGFNELEIISRLKIFRKGIVNHKINVTEEEYNDVVYCFTMPKGTIITRLGGKLAFTGNCNTFYKLAGFDVGTMIEEKLPNAHYLGNADGTIELPYKRKIQMLHPDGGSSYAISYRSQKIAESLEGGTKPDILLLGHFHKAEYLFYRNIHIFQNGTLEHQTSFMKGRHLSAHMGYWIITADVTKDGIDHIVPEFFPIYK